MLDLKQHPFFNGFDAQEIALLQSVMTIRTMGVNEHLFGKGDIARDCYFLLEGSVTIGVESETGSFQTFATLNSGELFGELALLDGGGRSASCRAGPSGARLAVLAREEFDQVFNSGQPFAYRLLDLIADRLIDRVRGAVVELGQVIEQERRR